VPRKKVNLLRMIFMTVFSDTHDKIKGFQLGAVDYITKPFQVEEVLSRIKIHLTLYFLRRKIQARNVELETQNVQLNEKLML